MTDCQASIKRAQRFTDKYKTFNPCVIEKKMREKKKEENKKKWKDEGGNTQVSS